MFEACIDGTLDTVDLSWDPRAAVCVTMASPGYPGRYPSDQPITGLDSLHEDSATRGVRVFHAGTKQQGRDLVTQGGRVLSVCALGGTLDEALAQVYAACTRIAFPGKHYRSDIGHRREAKQSSRR